MGRRIAAACFLLLTVAACGSPTREDILKRAEGADTKTLLEKAIGRPTDIKTDGPLERWTYKAADGFVTFMIAGDHVTVSTTSDASAP